VSAPHDGEHDPLLDEYVGAFRASETPAPEVVRDRWRAIEGRIARPRMSSWIFVAAGAAAAAALIVVLLASGREAATPEDDPSAHEQTPYGTRDTDEALDTRASRPIEAPEPASPVSPTAEVHEDPPADAARDADADAGSVVPDRPTALRPRARPAPADTDAPTVVKPREPSALAEETSLLRRAKAALARGDGSEALELVDEHGRRFPAGVFRGERAVVKARALCALGRRTEARAVADDFVRAHPGSHLAEQMAAVCPSQHSP
jgi:hypothetical protein